MSTPDVGDVGDAAFLQQLVRSIRVDSELLARRGELLNRLKELGVQKVGQRHRLVSLLCQRAAALRAPELLPNDRTPAIPRRLFTFWTADPSAPRARAAADAELVRCCIARMQLCHKGWDFRLLTPSTCADLPPPPVPASMLTGPQLADWYRLAALAAYGGVYLDASCVCIKSVSAWVDMASRKVQGWRFVPDNETMESWAIAAPKGSAFVAAWRDELKEAFHRGVKEYCDDLPAGVISMGLRRSLPYLTIHAAWRVVRARMPEDEQQRQFLLRCPTDEGGPFRYLATLASGDLESGAPTKNWDSPAAVAALFAMTDDELAGTPLVKLRGKERDSVRPLATYGRESALARTLLSATTPVTVAEQMAHLRCGLMSLEQRDT
jgi:hypothetical protein